MYVYLITNLINKKQYVGITNNYVKRWGNECSYPKNPKRRQVIQEAIHKYGKENFEFKILLSGLSIEQAAEKEEELIQKLQTQVPYGYNVDAGGNYHPTFQPQKGEKNGMAKITDEEAQYILDNRDKPEYVLYDEFSDRITYGEFKEIYLGKKFTHLTTNVSIYPFNKEFSMQFISSKLDYPDIVELREAYKKGVYWRDEYEKYKDIYPDEFCFWNVYNGRRYKYVMPEVFTEENKHIHSGLSKSGDKNGRAKLTKDDVIKIRELHNQGIPNTEIYPLYPQVSSVTIRDVINHKSWKNV